MVSLVTPGAVAPPLSPPAHGFTHGGAYPLGTATRPVFVSHFGPQSTCVPRALAWSKVSGPSLGAAAAGPTASATTVALASRATSARQRRGEQRSGTEGIVARRSTRVGSGAEIGAGDGRVGEHCA